MTDADLSSVVREIQTTAIKTADIKVVNLEVTDGRGGGLTLPVAFLPEPNGGFRAWSLLDDFREATAYARDRRLAGASGPDFRDGTAHHQSLDSFIAHVNRFKAPHSAVWADPAGRKLVSMLDYHPEGADSPARWGRHRGIYPCPLSEAWLAWGGGKALELEQDDFAALLDARDRELAAGKMPNGAPAPDPAALVTLATNLEVYSSATAKRERDLNTGRVKISYHEEKGVNGSVMPPPAFLVRIPVFQDVEPQTLEVRLRVTVVEGHARFSVQIHAAGDVLRESFAGLCGVVTAETELPLFVGSPEAP